MIRKHISLFVGIAVALCPFHVKASVAEPIRLLGESISNYLAAIEGEGTTDRKLVAALKKSISAANKASHEDIGANAKIVGQIAASVLRTSASNEFGAQVEAAVESYNLAVGSGAIISSNMLLSTYPSGPRNAAERNLAKVFGYVAGAAVSDDFAAAAKLVSKAAAKARVVDKLVAKAQAVPPPPAHVTANVTFQGSPSIGSIGYKSRAAGITPGAPGFFTLISGGTAGTELRTVSFALSALSPGENNVPIQTGVFTFTSLKRNGTFVNGTGTAQVNWNPDTHTLVGTFTFDMTEQGGSRTATINGSFSGTY